MIYTLFKFKLKEFIDFMTNTGKYRRPDLQQSLQEAHHLLAFRLPPCYWCYTPREFNKCADYLAGVARDHARECLASTTSTSEPLELSPFFCPLPPSLSSSFSPPPHLSTPPSSTHFTFPELPRDVWACGPTRMRVRRYRSIRGMV